jgi:sugar lactone lactonase YvrE
MAFDPAGNLWVASTGNGKVFEFNGPWGAVTGTSTPAVNITLATGLNRPEGLAFDTAGDLFVANEGSTTIAIFTAPIANGASPSGTLNGVTAPDSLAFDHSGNLYVGKVNGDIARYNATVTAGSSPNTIDPAAVTTAADIEGMAVDNASNVFVMSCNSNVLEFPTGTTAFSATMPPSVSLTFTGCGGVFVL